jgi:heat shock protein HspQ
MISFSSSKASTSFARSSLIRCRAKLHRFVGCFSFLPRRLAARTMATATSSQHDEGAALPAGDPHRRICTVLYRQLLRWCDETDQMIPLSKFIPPIHMKPPNVHPTSLRLVATNDQTSPLARSYSERDGKEYFPPNALIKETELTVPITNSVVAKQFFRAMFRMNAYPPPSDVSASSSATTCDISAMRKEQISFAFEGMRSLNEVSEKLLKILQESRCERLDRTGVKFRVGQVVQHTSQNWRAVIFGWSRIGSQKEDKEKSKAAKPSTSLTKKNYSSGHADEEISYSVALDWGDANIMQQSHRRISSIMEAHQSELSLVKDQDLLRIRSGQLGENFERFDLETQCFVPGEVFSYMYPKDTLDKEWSTYRNPSDPSAWEIIIGIQYIAQRSCDIIGKHASASDIRKLSILSSLLDRFTKLAQGNVIPTEECFHRNGKTAQRLMKHHLQRLLTLVVELNDTLWTRRISMETDRTIQYSLGQVVRHTLYGFRGVVVGWDSGKPWLDQCS